MFDCEPRGVSVVDLNNLCCFHNWNVIILGDTPLIQLASWLQMWTKHVPIVIEDIVIVLILGLSSVGHYSKQFRQLSILISVE